MVRKKYSISRFVIFMFFVFNSFCVSAQAKYDWSEYDGFTIKKDSVPKWEIPYRNVIYPINESKADIEIRSYFRAHNGRAGFVVFRCFGDSVLFENIIGESIFRCTNSAEEKEEKWIKVDSEYCWKNKKISLRERADSILNKLISNGLLTLANIDDGKKVMQKRHERDVAVVGSEFEISDAINSSYWEIKINQRYRSFYTYRIRYDDKSGKTDNLIIGMELETLFYKILNQ